MSWAYFKDFSNPTFPLPFPSPEGPGYNPGKCFEITDTGMLESLHDGHKIQHFDALGFVPEFVVYLLTITAWWCGGKFLFAGKSLPSSPFPCTALPWPR